MAAPQMWPRDPDPIVASLRWRFAAPRSYLCQHALNTLYCVEISDDHGVLIAARGLLGRRNQCGD